MFTWIKNKVINTKNDLGDFGKKLTGSEQIKESAKEIKEMAGTILSPKEQIKLAKVENFNQAMKRMSVNEAEIIQNYKNFTYVVYISLAFVIMGFLLAIYKLFIVRDLISLVPICAFLLLSLANAFKYSFRAYQIKHQNLCSIKEWWNNANEWIPKF